MRLFVWGGLICAVLAYTGYLRWPAWQETRSESADQISERRTPTEPGWPHVRGPNYSGVSEETGLADSWPPGGPPLVWKREIGRGYSGVTAVGNRLFTRRQTPTEQSVVCLDADTGSTVWEHRYGWACEPGGMYPGPRATPTWGAGRVYYAAPDGLVGCLRASDGARFWEVNVNKQFGGRGTEFGYACSPLVEAGKVILPVGGPQASVVALSAIDGSTTCAGGLTWPWRGYSLSGLCRVGCSRYRSHTGLGASGGHRGTPFGRLWRLVSIFGPRPSCFGPEPPWSDELNLRGRGL